MKTKYEYDVVDKETGVQVSWGNTRLEARIEKSIYEQIQDCKAKIIQRKYILQDTKEIR
jgi:hypothetical protein